MRPFVLTLSPYFELEDLLEADVEKIKTIIAEVSQQYKKKDGEVIFAGVDGGTVKIAPAGFCWR